jgi:two-component system LytT family response regulator
MNDIKYKAVIIDDENHCIDRIMRSLSNYSEITVTGTACNATDGSRLIMQMQPDLIFADVEMPGESGLDMMQQLEYRLNWDVHVVFHTAHNHYLLDALRTAAFDFLLKPYQDNEFNGMMQRWFSHLNRENVVFKHNGNSNSNNERRFMLSSGEGYQLCKTEHFVYAEYISSSKIWSVKLSNESTVYLKRGTKAEDILKLAGCFIQISQYCIVNCNYLLLTKNDYCVMTPPFDKLKFKVTRKFYKNLYEKFEGI